MKNIGQLCNKVMICPESDQIADLIIHQNLPASIIKSKGGPGISEMMDLLVLTQQPTPHYLVILPDTVLMTLLTVPIVQGVTILDLEALVLIGLSPIEVGGAH